MKDYRVTVRDPVKGLVNLAVRGVSRACAGVEAVRVGNVSPDLVKWIVEA